MIRAPPGNRAAWSQSIEKKNSPHSAIQRSVVGPACLETGELHLPGLQKSFERRVGSLRQRRCTGKERGGSSGRPWQLAWGREAQGDILARAAHGRSSGREEEEARLRERLGRRVRPGVGAGGVVRRVSSPRVQGSGQAAAGGRAQRLVHPPPQRPSAHTPGAPPSAALYKGPAPRAPRSCRLSGADGAAAWKPRRRG